MLGGLNRVGEKNGSSSSPSPVVHLSCRSHCHWVPWHLGLILGLPSHANQPTKILENMLCKTAIDAFPRSIRFADIYSRTIDEDGVSVFVTSCELQIWDIRQSQKSNHSYSSPQKDLSVVHPMKPYFSLTALGLENASWWVFAVSLSFSDFAHMIHENPKLPWLETHAFFFFVTFQ